MEAYPPRVENNQSATALELLRSSLMQSQHYQSPRRGGLLLDHPVNGQREIFDRLAKLAGRCEIGIGHHGRRVGKIAGLIAAELGLPQPQADLIARAAQLHDIGKIGIPDAILRRPGRLTRLEYEETKKHTSVGAKILSGFTFPTLQLASEIARYHHEHWNGGGYIGLNGEAIPLAARITAVADSVDAMLHDRPYQNARHLNDVLEIVRQERGGQFDPRVVDAFLGLVATGLHSLGEVLLTQGDAGSAPAKFIPVDTVALEARRRHTNEK